MYEIIIILHGLKYLPHTSMGYELITRTHDSTDRLRACSFTILNRKHYFSIYIRLWILMVLYIDNYGLHSWLTMIVIWEIYDMKMKSCTAANICMYYTTFSYMRWTNIDVLFRYYGCFIVIRFSNNSWILWEAESILETIFPPSRTILIFCAVGNGSLHTITISGPRSRAGRVQW